MSHPTQRRQVGVATFKLSKLRTLYNTTGNYYSTRKTRPYHYRMIFVSDCDHDVTQVHIRYLEK
ncbi:hypothetical protein F441_11226 [Phytophthora nicotianae CJ01A1]|uniref:Uncharacterized protein n=6 Tax=Phytophthora nicotianae TaxID=4792 RepID=W2Q326_PHYN3|nr:hypothetical protein PPTG_23207 [Phytophthora nicotianae INRA-310]ETI43894.1 hypothetical protein F443_11306 [Phytophthora nicotianae P1569]ETL90535.1 hypothetical protein L917_10821 [Phytophthora nicotianae]ETO72566.1 hypothetical protein F444_11372 [Phytophthora nicotianae P1976]ETP13735.1 hypothetical protein F441_11226 [Phytophthora nicotianae CJ01A1]ETP41776.1 hypothetical protein F442_11213 [Phytophthora nicotianae P10297]